MILTLNSGSSSVKFKLYDMPSGSVSIRGAIEPIGTHETVETTVFFGSRSWSHTSRLRDHDDAFDVLQKALNAAVDYGVGVDAIGHRVVHGGDIFTDSVAIDEVVLAGLDELSSLAPLHNPVNILGIRRLMEIFADLPHVAVFDTAFHHTMPPEAYRYALPDEITDRYRIRRYGFHGLSHAYISRQTASRMGRDPSSLNIISVHLGNGASVCAIRSGVSVDTSMGFTPAEGLVMGSRCGDLDPGIPIYLMRNGGYGVDDLDDLLNKKSGLEGLCGDSDMRKVIERKRLGDEKAGLAYDIFIRRVLKYIGAYAVLLERVDAIVFTGGIGQKSAEVRESICDGLSILGVRFDRESNQRIAPDGASFHSAQSRVELWVLPTDEESVIARETYRVVRGNRT